MFRPSPSLALAMFVAAGAISTPVQAEVKTFRDFVVACDNARDCVAYGLGADIVGAYLKIDRGGAPDAIPKITFAVDMPSASSFTMAFDDPALNAALPKGPFSGPAKDESTARVTVSEPASVAALLDALRKAKTLRVTRTDPPGGTASDPAGSELSMAGAVAALLWIDEQQKRLGTTTALIRRGDKPASAVPAPPALPVVIAAKANPAPLDKHLPKAIETKSLTLCGDGEDEAKFDEAKRLSDKQILYSFSCPSLSGAYNQAYAYLIAPEDAPQEARTPDFILPPEQKRNDKDIILVNADFDATTAKLTTFSKGRGLGDCGSETEWIWDGNAFRVVSYRNMPYCRGVLLDDWPMQYRATRK
jgi:hypothetical protein